MSIMGSMFGAEQMKNNCRATFVRVQLMVAVGRETSEELRANNGGSDTGTTADVAFVVTLMDCDEERQLA